MGKNANKTISGGQAAVRALQAENTEYVFGLIGSATMEMFDALYDADDINFIGIHDERTGTHMADGFARASVLALFLPAKMDPGQPILSPALPKQRQHSRRLCRLRARCRVSINIAMHFKRWTNSHCSRLSQRKLGQHQVRRAFPSFFARRSVLH